jgi:hypothetical protein
LRNRGDEFGVFLYSHLFQPNELQAELKETEAEEPISSVIGPAPPTRALWLPWLAPLQTAGRLFLLQCYFLRQFKLGKTKSRQPPTWEQLDTAYPKVELSGRRYSVIRNGKLVHIYFVKNEVNAFLLLLGDLLAAVDIAKLTVCSSCEGFFLRVKRQKYCRSACRQQAAPPAKVRVRNLRVRRATWSQQRQEIKALLAAPSQKNSKEWEKILRDAHAKLDGTFPRRTGQYEAEKSFLARTEKQVPQRMWEGVAKTLRVALKKMRTLEGTTERAALEQAEDALRQAHATFADFPHSAEEDAERKVLLAQAADQIKRLRKKVKGY